MSESASSSDLEVLYVAGTARSGSTVLAVLLGASPEILAAGELSFFFRDLFLEKRPCGCGVPSPECPLWSRVLSDCRWSAQEAKELNELTRSVDAHRAVPGHAVGLQGQTKAERYCDAHARIIEALRRASGARVIVDSSKYAARALALRRCLGSRLRILCLTRRPHGVIHSFLKPNRAEQKRSSVGFAAAYYPTVLTQLRLMAWVEGDDVLELSYEELCHDPIGTLGRIETWSGLDLSAPKAVLETHGTFHVGHMLTANRLRKQGSIAFRPEPEATLPGPVAAVTARLLDGWRRLLGFR